MSEEKDPREAVDRLRVFAAISEERNRQDEKWGEQNHTPAVWAAIIGEEYGEVCKAINEFGFNKNAYDALPADLRRILDHATAAVLVYALTEFHTKNAIALGRLRTEFKGKVEVLQLPAPVVRDLKKLAAEVVREESEKTPMARKVHASFTKFQALVGPWDHVAEGAYHQFVAV